MAAFNRQFGERYEPSVFDDLASLVADRGEATDAANLNGGGAGNPYRDDGRRHGRSRTTRRGD